MQSWLCTRGPVLLEGHVRYSKTEPLVDRVELLDANPQYAHVRYPDGRETTVFIRHLAPVKGTAEDESSCVIEVPITSNCRDVPNQESVVTPAHCCPYWAYF